MTSRAALAAARSLAVLSFLAANPARRYTLTELGRAIGVSPSSMYGILAVMTQTGYLSRHPTHKTYGLGLMAIAVGHGGEVQIAEFEMARSELRRVASPQGLKSAIVSVIDGDIVTLFRDGPLTGEHLTFVGQREPHVPPLGSIFVAWASRDAADRWLARAAGGTGAATLQDYREGLDAIREEGRAILVTHGQGLRLAVTAVSSADENHLLLPLEMVEASRLRYIGVPIFDAFGDVTLGLFIDELPAHLDVEDIGNLAARLQAAARNVMARVGGQPPKARPG